MSSPETSVEIPEWLQSAVQPLLQQTSNRYRRFQRRGENAVGDTFWDDIAREVQGTSAQEDTALRIAQNLSNVGRTDLTASRRLAQQGAMSNPLLQLEQMLLKGTGDQSNLSQVNHLLRRAGVIAEEQPTGSTLGTDRALQTGRAMFEEAMLPMIQNQAALAGVGRGTGVMNASAAGQAQYLLPMIQDAIGREERGIDRRYADATGRANTLFGMDMSRASQAGGAGRAFQQNKLNAANFRLGLGNTLKSNEMDRLNIFNQLGQERRGIRQERSDAEFNERMRRLGAYEQALAGPLGMVPGVYGSRTEKW